MKIIKYIYFMPYRQKWQPYKRLFLDLKREILDDAYRFLLVNNLVSNKMDLLDLANQWPYYVDSLFDRDNPISFYGKLDGSIGASNLIANINDQFSRHYLGYMLDIYIGRNNSFTGRFLDFGCGTAAVSLSWQKNFARSCKLLLADIQNMPFEFVAFERQVYSELDIFLSDVFLDSIESSTIDFAMCIHVLEHLENPSYVFQSIHRKLKKGGIILIEAPWGGHPEHLPQAPLDWDENGGAALLSAGYVQIGKMNPWIPFSGAYLKQ
jgi:SAM-dependent methyltransferase